MRYVVGQAKAKIIEEFINSINTVAAATIASSTPAASTSISCSHDAVESTPLAEDGAHDNGLERTQASLNSLDEIDASAPLIKDGDCDDKLERSKEQFAIGRQT